MKKTILFWLLLSFISIGWKSEIKDVIDRSVIIKETDRYIIVEDAGKRRVFLKPANYQATAVYYSNRTKKYSFRLTN